LLRAGKTEQCFSSDLPEPDGLLPENAAQAEPDPVLFYHTLLPIKKEQINCNTKNLFPSLLYLSDELLTLVIAIKYYSKFFIFFRNFLFFGTPS
jgi:hypothetical protein